MSHRPSHGWTQRSVKNRVKFPVIPLHQGHSQGIHTLSSEGIRGTITHQRQPRIAETNNRHTVLHACKGSTRHDSGWFSPSILQSLQPFCTTQSTSLSRAICLALVPRPPGAHIHAQRHNLCSRLHTSICPELRETAWRVLTCEATTRNLPQRTSQPSLSTKIGYELVDRNFWKQQSLELRSFVADTQCHLHRPSSPLTRSAQRTHQEWE